MIESIKYYLGLLAGEDLPQDLFQQRTEASESDNERIQTFYLEVPQSHIDASVPDATLELPFIAQQLAAFPAAPRYDLNELRSVVYYSRDSELLSDDDYYRKACLAQQYIELLDDSELISNELICPISFEIMKHPVRLSHSSLTHDFDSLHGYLATIDQVDQYHELVYTDPRTNRKYRGRPVVTTDVSFRNLAEEKLNAFLVKIQQRYERNADELQFVAKWLALKGQRIDPEDIPTAFFSAHSGSLMQRPIRLTNGCVIDLAEYSSAMGQYTYALDVMKQMEAYTALHHAKIHPSNTFICPFS
jgi:hypothetical protein